ncbi:hypothetical protein LOC68_18030 [Blastopirellula sp. JC732]|uniref:EF-hand domain-containing protein n=1 Tax=Blastopirellula sediminis TaxID=2894196 RepID=A0A9X1SHE2_9BACT|nr:hypothetical protein [Blastopirellula sediminis]MCC9606404.1 hypothetical protein [Blastopirellula sediminis]MCC9630298.1 hypothetical protein [Blastopirellula sediminis]
MNAGIPEELLSAYLDGQLGCDEVERVETALAETPALRKRLQSLAAARDAVRNLPKATVGRDLTADIFAEITRRSAAGAATETEVDLRPAPATRMSDRHRRTADRSWQWIGVGAAAAAVVAALLAIPAFLGGERDVNNNDVANVEPQDKSPEVKPAPTEVVPSENTPETATTERAPSFTELMGTGNPTGNPENLDNSRTKPDRKPNGLRIKITSNVPDGGEATEKMEPAPIGTGSLARSIPDLSGKLDSAFARFEKPADLSAENRRQLLSLLASEKEVSDAEVIAGLRKLPEALRSGGEKLGDLISKLDLDDDNQLESGELASSLAEARFHETEAGRQAARIFFRIDDNHDGVWTDEEVTKNVRLAGGSDQEFTRKIRLWDQNHDGVVNFVEAEFSAQALQREFQLIEGKLYDSQILAQAQRVFASSDRSGDGVLSGRELTKALESPEVAAAAQGRKTLSLHELYLHLESIALGL